ncbi:MAG TPA: DUF4192 domain-containing protein [Nocardioidaceae bacterium]|nr:DUF4192 domain-containing protein [Nocardioidaceae bacterium]
MSNRRRPLKPVSDRSPDQPDQPVARLSGPTDLVAMIPYLFGFQPVESVVVAAVSRSSRRLGDMFRLDLVDDTAHGDEAAGYLLELTCRQGAEAVAVVAYSECVDLADCVVQPLLRLLASAGIGVIEALRADGRRWWSYLCPDPACCPPQGTPYDAASSPAAAFAVVAGLTRAPDREALRELFAPASARERGRVAAEMARLGPALASAPRRPVGNAAGGRVGTSTPPGPPALAQGELAGRLVTRLEEALAEPDGIAADDLAWLCLAVRDPDLRGVAMALLDRVNALDQFEVWRRVMAVAPDPDLPAVGGLAALAAWVSGHGVLASHAAERVLEVDPCAALAELVRQLLAAGTNPAVWERLRGDVTRRPAGSA